MMHNSTHVSYSRACKKIFKHRGLSLFKVYSSIGLLHKILCNENNIMSLRCTKKIFEQKMVRITSTFLIKAHIKISDALYAVAGIPTKLKCVYYFGLSISSRSYSCKYSSLKLLHFTPLHYRMFSIQNGACRIYDSFTGAYTRIQICKSFWMGCNWSAFERFQIVSDR